MSSNPSERYRHSLGDQAVSPGRAGARSLPIETNVKAEPRTWGDPKRQPSETVPWVVCGLVSTVMIAGMVGWVVYWSAPGAVAAPPEPAPVVEKPKVDQSAVQQLAAVAVIAAADRSAFPGPDEVILTPIPARVISTDGVGSSSATAAAPAIEAPKGVIPWNQASQYLGQEVTVEGTIIETKNLGNVCLLQFSKSRDGFYLAMFDKAMNGWGEKPEKFFVGKKVQVRGKVSLYRERPQIKIDDARQVTVQEPQAAAVPAPASAMAPAAQNAAAPVISWSQAARFVGQTVTVEGVVVEAVKSKTRSVFLNFSNSRDGFYAVIFESNAGKFEVSPEQAFKGRKVQVTGRVTTFQDRPQIKIESPAQIKLMD